MARASVVEATALGIVGMTKMPLSCARAFAKRYCEVVEDEFRAQALRVKAANRDGKQAYADEQTLHQSQRRVLEEVMTGWGADYEWLRLRRKHVAAHMS